MHPDLVCLHHLAGKIILCLTSRVLAGMAGLLCRFDSTFFGFVCVLIKVVRENQLEEMDATALSGMRSSSPPCGVCHSLAVLSVGSVSCSHGGGKSWRKQC